MNNEKSLVKEMTGFIQASPTPFHAVEQTANILNENGFVRLAEGDHWGLEPGKDYYVVRNQSSIIAFRIGEDLKDYRFQITASHSDSPCFKLKERGELTGKEGYTRLNTEGYGGMLCSSWMDRPLSLAGPGAFAGSSGRAHLQSRGGASGKLEPVFLCLPGPGNRRHQMAVREGGLTGADCGASAPASRDIEEKRVNA